MRQPIKISYPIADKELEQQYKERDKYNFIKRKIIEHKYTKAVEKEIVRSFNNASKKDV